jgi:hypothetical protein
MSQFTSLRRFEQAIYQFHVGVFDHVGFGNARSREKKRCESCRKHQKRTAGGAFSPPAALSSNLLIN